MPRVENKVVTTKKQVVEEKQKKSIDLRIIKYTGIVLVSLALIFLVYLVLDKYVFTKAVTEPTRFETVDHITLDEFKWLLNDNDTDPVTGVLYDVYVFIYNPDYETCTTCETLENEVIQAAAAAEANGYSFFVLNYSEYSDISTYVSGLYLPTRPGLIHIEGEAYAASSAVLTSQTSILTVLNNLSN